MSFVTSTDEVTNISVAMALVGPLLELKRSADKHRLAGVTHREVTGIYGAHGDEMQVSLIKQH